MKLSHCNYPILQITNNTYWGAHAHLLIGSEEIFMTLGKLKHLPILRNQLENCKYSLFWW